MTKKLYVGGLPYNGTDELLENLFSTYGTVETVTVMINKITDLPLTQAKLLRIISECLDAHTVTG